MDINVEDCDDTPCLRPAALDRLFDLHGYEDQGRPGDTEQQLTQCQGHGREEGVEKGHINRRHLQQEGQRDRCQEVFIGKNSDRKERLFLRADRQDVAELGNHL